MGRILGSFGGTMAMAISAAVAGAGHAETARQTDSTVDLSSALNALARRYDIPLIYDPALIGKEKVIVRSASSPEAALNLLLANTRFTYRRLPGGAFVIVRRTIKVVPAPTQPMPSAGPEIVIKGRRSQNVDLVRGKDEVQPYGVVTADEIAASGAESMDDFLRTRVSTNRSVAPLSQTGASPRSQIDLRGLGAAQTLVLIDGRRFAGVPLNPGLFDQSDVNAIPLEAIDRIELLATSAGGIFGIGATGGVVNVILKRDYQGVLVSAERGVSARGDGAEYKLYGRVSWTSRSGRTRIMASGSLARDDGLLVGDRSFALDVRNRRVGTVGYGDPVISNSLNIQSVSGAPLTFTAANGGASLGSALTFMPVGTSTLGAAGLATLRANAGKQDLTLSPDGQGALATLMARTSRASFMASVRQDIGARSELFLDYLRFDDRGYQQGAPLLSSATIIPAGRAGNPFSQDITVTFPTSLPATVSPEDNLAQRVSAGLIRRLSGGWVIEADTAYSETSILDAGVSDGLVTTPRVFAGVNILNADTQPTITFTNRSTSTNRLIDANVRIVGPLATLPGGPLTLTVTGEFRREWSAGVDRTTTYAQSGRVNTFTDTAVPYSQNVWSAFGEARLPILSVDGKPGPFRGLSAQLALRLDRYLLDVPAVSLDAIHNRAFVPAATLGLQSRPLNGVMVRASYSTAATPPTPGQLQAFTSTGLVVGLIDPKRGGYQAYIPGYTFSLLYGSTSLRPQETGSLSAGLVLEPSRTPGLRLSIDFTRLQMRHQIETFPVGDNQYFLDNEALYPDRVKRAPLTAADQAAGYTGGRITFLDVGPLQTGTSHLETLDFAASYDARAGEGKLHLQADADWTLSYQRVSDPSAGRYDLVGYADGPIAWRANLGADWSTEHWSIGAQAQVYASYSLADRTPLLKVQILSADIPVAEIEALQAREPRVPVQAYFDMSVAYRPQGKSGMQIRASVSNILDQKPPVVASVIASPASAYIDTTPISNVANYGDVLGRRLSINVKVPLGL